MSQSLGPRRKATPRTVFVDEFVTVESDDESPDEQPTPQKLRAPPFAPRRKSGATASGIPSFAIPQKSGATAPGPPQDAKPNPFARPQKQKKEKVVGFGERIDLGDADVYTCANNSITREFTFKAESPEPPIVASAIEAFDSETHAPLRFTAESQTCRLKFTKNPEEVVKQVTLLSPPDGDMADVLVDTPFGKKERSRFKFASIEGISHLMLFKIILQPKQKARVLANYGNVIDYNLFTYIVLGGMKTHQFQKIRQCMNVVNLSKEWTIPKREIRFNLSGEVSEPAGGYAAQEVSYGRRLSASGRSSRKSAQPMFSSRGGEDDFGSAMEEFKSSPISEEEKKLAIQKVQIPDPIPPNTQSTFPLTPEDKALTLELKADELHYVIYTDHPVYCKKYLLTGGDLLPGTLRLVEKHVGRPTLSSQPNGYLSGGSVGAKLKIRYGQLKDIHIKLNKNNDTLKTYTVRSDLEREKVVQFIGDRGDEETDRISVKIPPGVTNFVLDWDTRLASIATAAN